MDRRDFLKRSIAASVMTAMAFSIDDFRSIWQPAKVKIGPDISLKGTPSGRMVYGGNLFTGYAHGRSAVDAADLRLQKIRLSQTAFLAGWQATSDIGSRKFQLKGAY
jgi:hypothetical protein